MAVENIRKFEERISGDEALRARLKELAESFEGDRQDERAIFEAVIGPLAAEVGLPYTYDEALECVAQGNEDLDAEEAKAIAGGTSYCTLLGFGDEVEADSCIHAGYGVSACAFVGVGAMYVD